MSKDKQLFNDLVEIFDEEYSRRNLITPQNTAEKLTAKGYRKTEDDIIDNIFGELESVMRIVKYPRTLSNGQIRVETIRGYIIMHEDYETIKKKYRDMIRGKNVDEHK